MLPDHLYDYPFDLYQRTRDITEIVNIIAADSGKKKLRILDVGGFRIDAEERETLLLREFLPDHEIFALDLNECFIPGYVKGDGTNLPFKDGVFDIVVTSDVYEHIPGNLRSRFIENLIRTSNAFVILGAPFYSPEAELGEKIIFEYVRKVLFAEQAQLKEHIDNRLPETGELSEFLKSNAGGHICLDSGNLDNWLMMMMVKHYLMTIPGSQDLHKMLDRFYNMRFYESDHTGTSYRKVFVSAKEKNQAKTLKLIEKHFATYEKNSEPGPLQSPDLNNFRMLLDLEELRTRRMLVDKDQTINLQAARIAQLENMRTTRIYRSIQFFNRIFFQPFSRITRFGLAKIQQLSRVITGARRHPYLSLSSSAYQRWITKNTPSQQESEVLEKKCNQFKYKPLISIAVPVYNTEKIWLEKAADSVLNQLYDNWELCFVNDGSDSHVRDSLRNIKNKDGRIKVTHLSRNKGIAAASNAAIAMATGEYIAFMDADDELHPHALFEIVSLLNNHRDADIIYTDEDKLTLDNQRRKPVFKNDWSPDLFLTYNYINHLTLCKKELLDKIDGFRPEYNWSQDYDLYLRATEATDNIYHIPKVLYHWRMIPESSASKIDSRAEALAKSKQLLTETLQRRGINGFVTDGLQPGTFKIVTRRG